MWYCPLGFVLTFVIGLLLSVCLNHMFKKPKVELDVNLFFPLVGERIRRKRERILESNDDVPKDNTAQRKYIFTIKSTNDRENMNEYNITKV